jgi:hypothetical protein
MAIIGIPGGIKGGSGIRGGRPLVIPTKKRPSPQQVKNRISPGRLRKIASERRVAGERRY